jgi:biotin synthase
LPLLVSPVFVYKYMNSASVTVSQPRRGAKDASVLAALANRDFGADVLRRALLLEGEEQQALFALARARRQEFFPHNEVEVRSVIEVSNVCTQQCEYCGMGKPGSQKYVLPFEEFMEVAGHLYASGRRVLLIQAGENRSQRFVEHVCRCVQEAKTKFPELEFILCIGNLSLEQYRELHQAGGRRYILKYETSNPELYARLKPHDSFQERMQCLDDLLKVGFKVGSGNIVGLPGQTLDDMVGDIQFAGKFALSMVSCSVFIPGEDSNLRSAPTGDPETALNTLALMRILFPNRLIPTTSPFEKVKKDGQYWGLMAGANTVTIHDGTPEEFRKLFPIYSGRRFTPNTDHIHNIVKRAGLTLAKGALI